MGIRSALIIGNSIFDYSTQFPQLDSVPYDVKELASVLEKPNIGGFDNVKTLLDSGYEELKTEIHDFFAGKRSSDVLLLYYSGHGKTNSPGRLFLIAKDTDPNRLRLNGVSASFVKDLMGDCQAKTIILILDCCFSGAFAREGSKSGMDRPVATEIEFGGGTGRVVLSATNAYQLAWTGTSLEGNVVTSPFTKYLVEGLNSGNADANQDGVITLEEWYGYAYDKIVETQPEDRLMTPTRWSYQHVGSSIEIAKNPNQIVKTLPLHVQEQLNSNEVSLRLQGLITLSQILQQEDKLLAEASLAALRDLSRKDRSNIVSGAATGLLASVAPDRIDKEHIDYPAAFFASQTALREIRTQSDKIKEENKSLKKRVRSFRDELQKRNKIIQDLEAKIKSLAPVSYLPPGSDNWDILETKNLAGKHIRYDPEQGANWSCPLWIVDLYGFKSSYLVISCTSASFGLITSDYYASSFSAQLMVGDEIMGSGAFVEQELLRENPKAYRRFNQIAELSVNATLSIGTTPAIDINIFVCEDSHYKGYRSISFYISAMLNNV